MSEQDQRRKRVVILAAAVALLSAVAPTMMRMNRTLGMVWVCLVAVALVYVIVEFGRAMRGRNR